MIPSKEHKSERQLPNKWAAPKIDINLNMAAKPTSKMSTDGKSPKFVKEVIDKRKLLLKIQ